VWLWTLVCVRSEAFGVRATPSRLVPSPYVAYEHTASTQAGPSISGVPERLCAVGVVHE
jgi:hypothetical protein